MGGPLGGCTDSTCTLRTRSAYNGGGYVDVIVGARLFDNGPTDERRAFVYYGNAGDGLDLLPRQMRADGSAPIAPLGRSDSPTGAQLRLTGRMPLGREKVKLQWQAAPLGTPFTSTNVISGASAAWTDTLTTGVVITQNLTGLSAHTAYHWRARLLYRPGNRLGQAAGRWVHMPWNGWNEQDFRTNDLLAGFTPVPAVRCRRRRRSPARCRCGWSSRTRPRRRVRPTSGGGPLATA